MEEVGRRLRGKEYKFWVRIFFRGERFVRVYLYVGFRKGFIKRGRVGNR